MFKLTEALYVFGMVLVLAVAQQEKTAYPRPPSPPKVGSYSDFPGLLADKNPVNSNIQSGQTRRTNSFDKPNKSSNPFIQKLAGPIVLKATSSYSGIPNYFGAKPGPTRASNTEAGPKSAKGVPVSMVAANELRQAVSKPKPKTPLTRGFDKWTPMGYTGKGETIIAAKTGSISQQLPYDPNKSKQTIGEQIMQQKQQQQQQQQQQHQQQQQQYDIFGFPINNSPGNLQSALKTKSDPFEIITVALESQNHGQRHRRQVEHEMRYDQSNIFNSPPPKKNKRTRPIRPPPPPALQEEMFHGQVDTQYTNTKAASRYSGIASQNNNNLYKNSLAGEKANVKQAVEAPIYPKKNIIKLNLQPSPVTPGNRVVTKAQTLQPTPPPKTPSTKSKADKKAPPSVPKVKAAKKIKQNRHTKVIKNKQKAQVNKQKKAAARHTGHEAGANAHDAPGAALELGESPKEAHNAEATLELQSLLGNANKAHGHAHGHSHAHTSAHAHSHAHASKPSVKSTPVKPKKAQRTKPAKPEMKKPAPSASAKTDAKAPMPEVEAQFSSMFDAWYGAKFGTTKPPSQNAAAAPAKSKQGPKTNSVDKSVLFKEFMTMFKSKMNGGGPTAKVPKDTAKAYEQTAKKPTAGVTEAAAKTSKHSTNKAKANAGASPTKVANAKSSVVAANETKASKVTPGTTKKGSNLQNATQPPSANNSDPTQVKLVSLTHPEVLAVPSGNKSSHAHANYPTRAEVLAGLNNAGVQPHAHQMALRPTQAPQQQTTTIVPGTTTLRPTIDPDILADINEARVGLGQPELLAHQVDVHGNLLPSFQRRMRIGRLSTRPHPLHGHGGMLSLQHQLAMPHSHPEHGFGTGFNSIANILLAQQTNNGRGLVYEPYPRPNYPVVGPSSAQQNSSANVTKPAIAKAATNEAATATAEATASDPMNSLAYFIFINALNSLMQNQNRPQQRAPQRNPFHQFQQGQNGPNGLFNQNNLNNMQRMQGNMPLNGLNQFFNQNGQNQNTQHQNPFAQFAYNTAQSGPQANNNGHADPTVLDLHHQAIHLEAGNAMTPNVHRQVHRLLRQRQLSARRQGAFSAAAAAMTAPPIYDPDLMADMLEAQQAALAG